MKHSLITSLLILFISNCFGQDTELTPEVKKYFLLVASTIDYEEAFSKASSISKQLELKLDLRKLIKGDDNLGLTWDKSECEGNAWDYPCYVARGRYDDGDFVSIEWSSAYEAFSEGYFVVMIASHNEYNNQLKNLLKQARKYIPTAYVKSSMVYMGCMH